MRTTPRAEVTGSTPEDVIEPGSNRKRGSAMGDRGGKKDKAKHDKQAQVKKDSKNDAVKKNLIRQTGQDKTPLQR
ncbi:MAG: hypothetical protein AB2L13_20110 [Spirochaetota bacterium]